MDAKILIVEDQFIEANNLRRILSKAGYQVCGIAASYQEAIRIKNREKPDMVLLDIGLQGTLTGIDLARVFKAENTAFVFLSANSTKQVLEDAKETMPNGFLVKPFRERDVLVTLDVAWYLHQQNYYRRLKPGTQNIGKENDSFKEIIGKSTVMNVLQNNIDIVGPSGISVLILGESGTGKELVAKCIHRASSRKQKPFIVINCAALPSGLIESELFGHEKGAFTGAIEKRVGKFEQADNGTVFLDEIGELPLDLQVKLLRVLQEREIEPIGGRKRGVDVRIIAATNRNLEEEIVAGRFRLDLYYRLNVFPITLPPLRDRKGDIPLLASHFLQYHADRENISVEGIADDVMDNLLAHNWPGNIRELENVMARSVLLNKGGIIRFIHLPPPLSRENESAATFSTKTINENEREYIMGVLKRCGGKLDGFDGAAKMMDINVSTLRSRMKKLGIDKQQYAGA